MTGEELDQTENKQSESNKMAEFNAAFAKFQSEVKAPKKNGKASFKTKKSYMSYTYVNLDDLIKSITKTATKYGFSFMQNTSSKPIGQVMQMGKYKNPYLPMLVGTSTTILYKNGFNVNGEKINAVTNGLDPQEVGKVVTYTKRYSLSAIFGVNSDEDDDATGTYKGNYGGGYGNSSNYQSYQASEKQANTIKYLFSKAVEPTDSKDLGVYQNIQGMVNNDTLSTMTSQNASRTIKFLEKYKRD